MAKELSGPRSAPRSRGWGGATCWSSRSWTALSRSMADFAGLLQRAEAEGWSLAVLDVDIDTTTPQGELVAHVLVAVAHWERRMISQRVREGLARSEKRLGRRPGLPAVNGAGRSELPDPVLAVIRDLRAAGRSPRYIADRLNAYGHPSPRGKRWHRGSVRRVLARLES
jgi:DNA invertase Pin-like site-specific DNA recombinase